MVPSARLAKTDPPPCPDLDTPVVEQPCRHVRRAGARFWQRPASAAAAAVGRQLGAMRAAAVAAASSGARSEQTQPQARERIRCANINAALQDLALPHD